MTPILNVENLTRIHGKGCDRCIESTGPEHDTSICPHCGSVVAVANASFRLHRGEVLGIMGESGSGKSSLVKMLYFDDQPTSGRATYHLDGQSHDLFSLNEAQQRRLRDTSMGMVYQNPSLGLNFDISAGGNIAERLLMSDELRYAVIREKARALLARTEVPPARMDELPRNFSGGMQQRVQIARAISTGAPLLFLDEVTTGLDLSVQARILDLIMELQEESGVSMLVVTHDLGVVRHLTTRTIVMKYGRIIESGLTDQILEDPQAAYTQQLVSSAL
ncbi:phosphonate C-P lyase system protein PhnK [Frigidibacter albus]